jgi:transcriptional regulator with XRE-family HTH domain
MASRREIGEKIRSARKDLGYTQKTLSEKSRVNKTTISEVENGHFTGSFDLFEKILDRVGLQFEVVPKSHKLPNWHEIKSLFKEDDD